MRISLLSLSVLLLVFTSATFAAQRPNVIVILADDLGYGDVGCYGATELETPHIDRLSAQGLRFTSGYCSASTCTPTRFSLLTGKYAFRQKGTGIAPPNATALIQPGTETIASILDKAGYATAVIGKWHLGLGAKPQPDWNDSRPSVAHGPPYPLRGAFGSSHPGGFNVVLCDGSVRSISFHVDLHIFERLSSRNDGGLLDRNSL